MRTAIYAILLPAISLAADRSPTLPVRQAADPVFGQEAGIWTTTYTLWPQGFAGPVKSYKGTEINVLSADQRSLARSYESRGLFDNLTGPSLGKEGREDVFKWGTGHGATLHHDRKSGKYRWEWSGDLAKRIGWMEGTYDPKKKTLTMKYINPYKSTDNSQLTHTTEYVDADTKKTTLSVPVPENRDTPLPTSFTVFEILAKRKRP
jgi:hypothetical protein